MDIARELGDRRSEGNQLGNLGNIFADLGNTHKAIEYYEQALLINQEIGNHNGEAATLGNLGVLYHDFLGEIPRAIEYYQQQLTIVHDTGDRDGEGTVLGNLGEAFANLGNYTDAIRFVAEGIEIGDEISNPSLGSYNNYFLAYVYLLSGNLVSAQIAIAAGQKYNEPKNNHNISKLLGIIALRQGERETAQEAFTKSIAQADEILAKTPDYYSALDAKGLSICGLTICDLRLKKDDLRSEAIETFRKARKIAPHAGVVKSVLRLFDELMKCEGGEILKDVRKAAEGVE